MSYFARFSPKLRWLSRAPSALALTFIPGADFSCARAINSKSPLGSGLKRNEIIIVIAIADTKNTIATPKALYNRVFHNLFPRANVGSRAAEESDELAPSHQIELHATSTNLRITAGYAKLRRSVRVRMRGEPIDAGAALCPRRCRFSAGKVRKPPGTIPFDQEGWKVDGWMGTAKRTGLPSPVGRKAHSMPTHHSLRPDNGYGVVQRMPPLGACPLCLV